jgi:GTPase
LFQALLLFFFEGIRSLDQELQEEIQKELPADLPSVFISSVAQKGIEQLKDLLWTEITR